MQMTYNIGTNKSTTRQAGESEHTMKTYEITYSNGNDIYSANLVIAESAEQATAYYTAKGREVIGCTETMSRPKPGQPVVTVPEGWTAPAAETETTETIETAEQTIETAQDAERDNRIADIVDAIRREKLASVYRAKQRTTARNIRESMRAGAPTVCVGYCDAQSMLSGITPDYYTAGMYGWNFDVYIIAGLTICTGYRGMIGSRAIGTAEHEQRARAAADSNDHAAILAEWIADNLDALREEARA